MSTIGIKRDGVIIPQKFETIFKLRGKRRHIILEYDESGKLKNEYVDPPEDRNKRKAVPMELKAMVIDPLTVFFQQREEIHRALKSGESQFTIRAYDGRRLTDLEYTVHGREVVYWNQQDVPVIHFTVSRIPIAGYKKSELEKIEESQDPSVSLYLSDDGRLLPLKIVIDSSAGKFHANYEHPCDTFEACIKRMKR